MGREPRGHAPGPRGDAQSMGDSNPAATFGYVARKLGKRKIAFLCVRDIWANAALGLSLRRRSAVFILPTKVLLNRQRSRC